MQCWTLSTESVANEHTKGIPCSVCTFKLRFCTFLNSSILALASKILYQSLCIQLFPALFKIRLFWYTSETECQMVWSYNSFALLVFKSQGADDSLRCHEIKTLKELRNLVLSVSGDGSILLSAYVNSTKACYFGTFHKPVYIDN